MNTKVILGGALAAQLVVAASLFVTNTASDAPRSAEPWLDFATSEVDRIVIADGTQSATIDRNGDKWQLGDLQQLPASSSRITTMLDTLNDLKTRWPVVSSASGRERFEVTEDKFQRHLQLYSGDKLLGDYYFGTSPGFRQTHARRAKDDEVYALAFNNFDLPVDDNDWLDKSLLQVSDIDHIQGDDFELTRNGSDWQLTPTATPDATALDSNKAMALATALQGLQVLRVADSAPAGETRSLTAKAGGTSWVFRFTKAGSNYVVQRSDREQAFTVSAADYDRIAALTRSSLLQTPPAAENAEPATTTAQ